MSRGIGLVSKGHKLSYLEELITQYLSFSHIFVIVTICGEKSMETIQVKLFNAGTGQQNDYGKTFISFVEIVDTILTSRFLSIQFWHLASGGLELNVYLLSKILLYQYPINIGDRKVACQQGRHVFEVAGLTVNLPSSGRRAGTKIEHC